MLTLLQPWQRQRGEKLLLWVMWWLIWKWQNPWESVVKLAFLSQEGLGKVLWDGWQSLHGVFKCYRLSEVGCRKSTLTFSYFNSHLKFSANRTGQNHMTSACCVLPIIGSSEGLHVWHIWWVQSVKVSSMSENRNQPLRITKHKKN